MTFYLQTAYPLPFFAIRPPAHAVVQVISSAGKQGMIAAADEIARNLEPSIAAGSYVLGKEMGDRVVCASKELGDRLILAGVCASAIASGAAVGVAVINKTMKPRF
jgi:hypothetical protein